MIPRVILRLSHLIDKTVFRSQINGTTNRLLHTTCIVSAKKFTEKHEWVEVNGRIGTIGISQFAQEALGDVVFAQLPDVDTVVKQKDECGALESVKAASELYSPVSGKIIAKNSEVEEKPSLINTSCYDKGWLFKIELANEKEVSTLMDEEQYKEFLRGHDDH